MRHTARKVGLVCVAGLVWLGQGAAYPQTGDLTKQFRWKPVKLGAGGFVVGMTLHPLNPQVRYARTDVGNAYRWDAATQRWLGMRVLHKDGTGVQSVDDTAAPSTYGVNSIAVDPSNEQVVYIVFPTLHSCDVGCANHFVQIYKSVDGGRNFAPGGLAEAKIEGDPNGEHRQYGERLVVDPANPDTLYYGSDKQGLFRSHDGGATWSQVGSGLPRDVEFINVQIVPQGNSAGARIIYAVSIRNKPDAGGDIYGSTDNGETWKDLSRGVTSGGFPLEYRAAASSLDVQGRLYVVENPASNGNVRAYWTYATGQWKRTSLEGDGHPAIAQPPTSIAADPVTPTRLYALGADTSMSRSNDGGLTWTSLGPVAFKNKLGWLPQTVGMQGGSWHSNGGLHFDRAGNLWVPTGQEGILMMTASDAARATSAVPPLWTILSTGIEEQVTQDALIPRGGGGTMILAAEDTTGFIVRDPDTFSSPQIPLQQEIIAQGTSVDAAPDAPAYIALTSSNVYSNGRSYSGYSADGGTTWSRFGGPLQYDCAEGKRCDTPAGVIAISVRGGRGLGHDHLVVLPPFNLAPQYSTDGGATWKVSKSFPLMRDGVRMDTKGGSYTAFSVPALHQHLLRADPFVADRFYLKLTHAPAPFYISVDGGATWKAEPEAGLPDGAFHGQLAVNPALRDELWYADGWEGSAAHGLYRSVDGGSHFQPIGGFRHAISLAVGKGRGRAGDQLYTVYVYGQRTGGGAYGIFQSTDTGTTWDRIAGYPLGIYDRPVVLAASPDTYGRLVLGWNGNSFAYSDFQPADQTASRNP